MSTTYLYKYITFRVLPLMVAFALFSPQALAARYFLSDNNNLVKGCNGTIEMKIDTEGSPVIAGDSTLQINSGQVSVNQLTIGSSLPMQVFNTVSSNEVKLSGARLPMTGAFNGVGTFGYINFTPSISANSGTFTFSADLQIDNNMVDQSIANVLTAATGKTYTFKNRYNTAVDGVGFCTPDETPAEIQFISPGQSASNVALDTNIVFAVSDNRAGVDLGSIQFSVKGVNYTVNSPQVTYVQDAGLYRIEIDPDADFEEGEAIQMNVSACDLNSPANCKTKATIFFTFTPEPLDPVCGDSIPNYINGEQCDDGNTDSGDGCSALCLFERIVVSATGEEIASTCEDGLHNQGESGIDCGGPCEQGCPTCVDGTLNQGEEGVDCGGPCPSCVLEVFRPAAPSELICEVPEFELVTICHFPETEDQTFYTLVIPDFSLLEHEAHGDSTGPCSLDEIVIEVDEEVEEAAVEEAVFVSENVAVIEVTETTVAAPETQIEVLSQIEFCRKNPDYADADFDSGSSDTDGDGLSDRTECYAETNPLNTDTDGDGCSDGDELNQFSTNPLDGTDCTLVVDIEEGFLKVIVSDPKPGWTLGTLTPRFSGISPLQTEVLTITAFYADQNLVKDLIAGVNALLQSRDASKVSAALDELDIALAATKEFVDLNEIDFNYVQLKSVSSNLSEQADVLRTQLEGGAAFVLSTYYQSLQELGIGTIVLDLGVLLKEPIVVGSTNILSDTILGEEAALSYEFRASEDLEDQKLYNVVATATRSDRTISSSPIQFGVNTGFQINKPVPRTLAGQQIPEGGIAFGGQFIDFAMAQEGGGRIELEIEEERPTVTGDSEFGAQVFAIWNSVVLSSSVISDSEQGAFEIQAPRSLEKGAHHRVTLYAVKTDEEQTLRSGSVDVFFRIQTDEISYMPFVIVSLFVLGLGIAVIVVRRLQTASTIKILNLKKLK